MVMEWVREGLSEATTIRYKKSWTLWIKHISAEGHGDNVYLDRVGREEQVKVIVLFIRSVCLGSQGSKTAMEVALAAVHAVFTQAGKSGAIFTSDTVRLARKSSIKKTAGMVAYEQRNDKKLPVAYEMLAWMRKHYWQDKDWLTQVDSRITYLASALALDGLLRVSEYAHVPKSHHMLRCRDIAFELEGSAATFQPGELRAARAMLGSTVRRVQLHIPQHRSKVSKSERKIFVNWRGIGSGDGLQLVEDLAEFCVREGGFGDAPLFSRVRNGRMKLLNYHMIVTAVKAAAVACGLSPKDFSSHSLRIGGATAMCAAGWQRSKIQQRGGWSELSDSDLIYARSLPSDSEGVSSDRRVTIDDIKWLQVFHNPSG